LIRLAAVGDVHVGADSAGLYRPQWAQVSEQADVFLLAGDLTRHGEPEEAAVLAGELRDLGVPVVAVLGNHDYQSDRQDEIRQVLEDAGVTVLEGESTVVKLNGTTVGIAGSKGFGGGFVGSCASDFGEPEMKAFVRHTKAIAVGLVGADEEVDVVGVTWPSRSAGDHSSHEHVGHSLRLDGLHGLAQHPQEHVFVDIALALPDLEVQLGDLLRLRILVHGHIVVHLPAPGQGRRRLRRWPATSTTRRWHSPTARSTWPGPGLAKSWHRCSMRGFRPTSPTTRARPSSSSPPITTIRRRFDCSSSAAPTRRG